MLSNINEFTGEMDWMDDIDDPPKIRIHKSSKRKLIRIRSNKRKDRSYIAKTGGYFKWMGRIIKEDEYFDNAFKDNLLL